MARVFFLDLLDRVRRLRLRGLGSRRCFRRVRSSFGFVDVGRNFISRARRRDGSGGEDIRVSGSIRRGKRRGCGTIRMGKDGDGDRQAWPGGVDMVSVGERPNPIRNLLPDPLKTTFPDRFVVLGEDDSE